MDNFEFEEKIETNFYKKKKTKFKTDLLEKMELSNHPKAELIFNFSWTISNEYAFQRDKKLNLFRVWECMEKLISFNIIDHKLSENYTFCPYKYEDESYMPINIASMNVLLAYIIGYIKETPLSDHVLSSKELLKLAHQTIQTYLEENNVI